MNRGTTSLAGRGVAATMEVVPLHLQQLSAVRSLLDQTPEQLAAWFADRGLPAYRAMQLRRWLFERRAAGFDGMTDLPKQVRAALAAEFTIGSLRIARRDRSPDGTEKLLVELDDGNRVECV